MDTLGDDARANDSGAAFWQSVLDSLTAHVAVLDQHGVVLAVNAAWRRFADANGLDDPNACVGVNYLRVCEAALGEDAADARRAAARIRAVLSRRRRHEAFAYPCHGPTVQRWFMFRATCFEGPGPARIVVAHENISAPRAAELRARRNLERVRRAEEFERQEAGILELVSRNELLDTVLERIVALVEWRCGGLAAILPHAGTSRRVITARRMPAGTDETLADAAERMAAGDGTQSPGGLVAALRGDAGDVLGRLVLLQEASRASDRDALVLRRASHLAALAIERRRLHDQLSFQARHDPVTGLPNRLLLQEQLDAALVRAERRGTVLTVFVVGLDRFRRVNDLHGHAAGDAVLRLTGARLRRLVAAGDLVARLGGDTFVVVCGGVPDDRARRKIAARLLSAFEEPFALPDTAHTLTGSIGIGVVAAGDAGRCAGAGNTGITRALSALVQAKARGGGRAETCGGEGAADRQFRRSVARHLEGALDRGEFSLDYQPQVDRSGAVRGVEALVRWRSPVLGRVAPGTFVPAAEESGAIMALGVWVLRTACERAAAWRGARSPVDIAVNVSGAQLADRTFPATVAAVLRETRLPPELLRLELTESVVMHDVPQVSRQLHDLRALGVRIALDHFGIGYSSLALLRALPVDGVKIDRSFVADLGDSPTPMAMLRSIVDLVRQLELPVVVEGVETAAQLAAVRTIEPDLLQGFLLHRPLSASEIDRLVCSAEPRAACA